MTKERGSERQVQPLRPKDVVGRKLEDIPDLAIEAFNELIARKINNGYACILQENVVELMVEKGLSREEIFEKGWLNVEGIYRKAGWDVTYDKPAYNESHPASFTFKPSSK